jgi:hypothetical protein
MREREGAKIGRGRKRFTDNVREIDKLEDTHIQSEIARDRG